MIKKTTLALLLILLSIYSYGQESSIELPLIGDRLSGAVSETEEEALGRQFLRDLKRESAILYDPIVQEWTELFIYKIGEKSKVNKKAFELLIIEDNNLSVCTNTRKTWALKKLTFENINNKYITYYKYKNKYPHAGAGIRVQF